MPLQWQRQAWISFELTKYISRVSTKVSVVRICENIDRAITVSKYVYEYILVSVYVFIVICKIDGLMQDCSISIANALEILQSCTKSSIYLSPSLAMSTDDIACSMPFTYNNVEYHACTTVHHVVAWCSYDNVYVSGSGRWGECRRKHSKWRHHVMNILSELLILSEGKPPVTHKGQVIRNFIVFFLCVGLNMLLKQTVEVPVIWERSSNRLGPSLQQAITWSDMKITIFKQISLFVPNWFIYHWRKEGLLPSHVNV